MSDIHYDDFYKWVNKRLDNGDCKNCSDYKEHNGPQASNEKCRNCFEEKAE